MSIQDIYTRFEIRKINKTLDTTEVLAKACTGMHFASKYEL